MIKDTTKKAESESAAIEAKATASQPTGDWISRTDPNTQRVYYFNKRTNKTQWEEPVEMQSTQGGHRGKATVEIPSNAESSEKKASEWKEMTDKTSGRKFYYNINTKKTQWNKPLEVSGEAAPTAAQKETITQQSAAPAKQDSLVASTSSWIKRQDKKSGRYFYYNSETKKTQWEIPVGFVENSAVEEKPGKNSVIEQASEIKKDTVESPIKKKKQKRRKRRN